jgi:hypothetical protein
MEYQSWVPEDLKQAYEDLLQGEMAFSVTSYTLNDLNQHAQRKNFPSWSQLQEF